jgi:rod shape-determining protein MreC
MGVIGTKGIVGVVDQVDDNYSRVLSILSKELSINAQIKGSNIIGSLKWNGTSPYRINLVDVPRLANIKQGDTIITGQQSLIFPPNIMVGTVEELAKTEDGSRYNVQVKLSNDLTDLGHVYTVKNKLLPQIRRIDTLNNNE